MSEITAQMAGEAKSLINIADAHPHLIALAASLPAEVKAAIAAAHDADPDAMCCAAHGEGLACCIDILLDDPQKYAPDRVAAAKELLTRWQDAREGQ